MRWSSPRATAWSYTHLPTATSSIPMPKGEKMIGRLRFTDFCPWMISASVPVTKLRFPVSCAVRWGEVFAFIDHILRPEENVGVEVPQRDVQHHRVVIEQPRIVDVRYRRDCREDDQIRAAEQLRHVRHNRDRAVVLGAAHRVFELLTLGRRRVVQSDILDRPSGADEEVVDVARNEPGAHDAERL